LVRTHGCDAGRSPLLSFQTCGPLAVIVYVLLPAAAPSTQMLTHTVPLTVAPGLGVVTATLSVPPLLTVTVMPAVAVAPVLSRTVRPSVWLPAAYASLVHPYVGEAPDATWMPSMVSVYV